ncbi:unnamed protein product, partial [Ixodes hexagonus]
MPRRKQHRPQRMQCDCESCDQRKQPGTSAAVRRQVLFSRAR